MSLTQFFLFVYFIFSFNSFLSFSIWLQSFRLRNQWNMFELNWHMHIVTSSNFIEVKKNRKINKYRNHLFVSIGIDCSISMKSNKYKKQITHYTLRYINKNIHILDSPFMYIWECVRESSALTLKFKIESVFLTVNPSHKHIHVHKNEET